MIIHVLLAVGIHSFMAMHQVKGSSREISSFGCKYLQFRGDALRKVVLFHGDNSLFNGNASGEVFFGQRKSLYHASLEEVLFHSDNSLS